MWLFEIKKIIDTTVTSQNIIFATKDIFYIGLYSKETNHTHAKNTLVLLKQDILTCWTDLEKDDFENEVFLKELNACIGYYNEYKRGQVVKTTKK